MWWACKYLHPALQREAQLSGPDLTFETFGQIVGVPVQEKDWNEMKQTIQTMHDTKELLSMDEMRDPGRWYLKKRVSFGSLTDLAVFLLRLPCVVTTCDSVMSLEGSLFADNQRRMDPNFAMRYLQWSASGDFQSLYPENIRKSW